MKNRLELLVCYDVETVTSAGKSRLRKMSKVCSAFGQRVQYSVFELSLPESMFEEFLRRALKVINAGSDSLRIYSFHGSREEYLKVYGRDGWVNFEAPLVI